MELAKITARGQITLPQRIRTELGVRDGDKIVFLENNGQIVLQSEHFFEENLPLFMPTQMTTTNAEMRQNTNTIGMRRALAIKAIRENRKNLQPVTVQEILDWRNEGRP
jgi:AbrB family looped-hinge helix DNA binding protein